MPSNVTTLLWKAKNGSAAYTDMPSPSDYNAHYEDLDNESYRSVANGNLVRDLISRRWWSVSMTFNYLTADQVYQIASIVNADNLVCSFLSPAFGVAVSGQERPDGTIGRWLNDLECYVSKFDCKPLKGQKGWYMSFTVVQSKVAPFQS